MERDVADVRIRTLAQRPLAELGSVSLGALSIWAGAWLSFPLPGAAAPQSAQTLAVLLAGLLLGARGGAAAGMLYLALGASGLPVFAEGAAGPAVLAGPTGGFLVAFPLAAAFVGWWRERGRAERFLPALAAMGLAHAGILIAGWARLAPALGAATAFTSGVRPFLIGAVGKSVVAAAIAAALARARR